jgi:hypothetical protein
MNSVQARKAVLVSSFLLVAIAVYRDHKAGAGDTFKALWGVGVVSLVLSILADFAPTIAGPFAALIVLGSLTEKGNNVIGSALSKVGNAPASSSPSAAASGHAGGASSSSSGGKPTVQTPTTNRVGGAQ